MIGLDVCAVFGYFKKSVKKSPFHEGGQEQTRPKQSFCHMEATYLGKLR